MRSLRQARGGGSFKGHRRRAKGVPDRPIEERGLDDPGVFNDKASRNGKHTWLQRRVARRQRVSARHRAMAEADKRRGRELTEEERRIRALKKSHERARLMRKHGARLRD